MNYVKVTPDEFSIAMDEILNDISKETQDVVKDAVGKAGRKGAKVLRTVSPVSSLPTSGKYRKSWSCKVEEHPFSSEATIYNKLPGMPHLIEKGHSISNQYGPTKGHAAAKPHIDQGVKAAEAELERLIEKGLSKL